MTTTHRCLAALAVLVTGCHQAHQRPYEPSRCEAPTSESRDRVLLLERDGDTLSLVEETFDGVARPIARLGEVSGTSVTSLRGSPDGATALVYVWGSRVPEHAWLVELSSGAVRDLAPELLSLPDTTCGPTRPRGGGTRERVAGVDAQYRGDARRILFGCRRILEDAERDSLGMIAGSAHEYDLETGAWRTVATGCDVAQYTTSDPCAAIVVAGRCDPSYRYESMWALVDGELRSLPLDGHAGLESVWLSALGYLITTRDGVAVTLRLLDPAGAMVREVIAADAVNVVGQSADGALVVLEVLRDDRWEVVWVELPSGRALATAPGVVALPAAPDARVVVAQRITAPYESFLISVDGDATPLPTATYADGSQWQRSTFDPSGRFVLSAVGPYALATSSGELVHDFAAGRLEVDGPVVRWLGPVIEALAFRVARP